MDKNNKQGKIMFGVVFFALLLIILVGITYAFFNYTRTGTNNIIKTGRIYFNSEQDSSINLTNMFPIDVTGGIPNDNTKVGSVTINVAGDTTYNEGVEYLISASNVYNSVGNKSLPISIDISFSANGNGKVIGTEDNDYFTNRGGATSLYKILANDTISNDDKLVVGYITEGQTGINGNIVIRAYLDKEKIAISDTYPEGDVDTNNDEETDYTNNTSNLWVDERVVFTTSEWNSLQANGVSFQIKVEANEGVWVNNPNSFYEVIKKNVDTITQINFANISSDENGKGVYILPGTENDANPIYYYRGEINNNNVIFGGYCWQMVRTTDTGGVKMIYNGIATGNGETCENTTFYDRIISQSVFNSTYDSVSDVGYMSNARYVFDFGETSGAIYGKDVEWDGTNYLVIEDTEHTASTNETKDNYHHYSCGTSGTTSCESVRYYYYYKRYIVLTNGDTIEDALYKMTGTGSIETKQKNSSYVLNQNNSTVKGVVDTWFETNLTNEIDNTKTDYRTYLEDTVYCNDRSFKTEPGDIATFLESGWNKNGGDLTKHLYFGSTNRAYNGWYSVINVPTVACPNESDRFTVSGSNGNGALTYPVGLLTADEIIMAGASGNAHTNNQTFYLCILGYNRLSMSPFYFIDGAAFGFSVFTYGGLNSDGMFESNRGVRPVISLKSGIEFEAGGNGTPTNPYVVKYN